MKKVKKIVVSWRKYCEGEKIDNGKGGLVYNGDSFAGAVYHSFHNNRLYETGEGGSFLDHLDKNGYDIKTLKFSICKKIPDGET